MRTLEGNEKNFKKTMCGIVKEVNAPGGLVYHTDLPIPEVRPDEVLVKVRYTAICGSDLHIEDYDAWTQKRLHAPVTLGHETSGEIVEVGAAVTERKVGDRISCESHITCGECWFCKNGMSHICKNTKLFGVTQNGAFAEYFKIRWDCTYLLDDSISDEAGCMFEPMGVAAHGAESADVAGKVVLVSGCGPIGLTVIAACKTFGAKKVIACDLIDERLKLATEMGADVILNSGKCDLPEAVKDLTGGIGADAAIDITGSGAALNTALKCLRAAGKLVCVALPSKPITFPDMSDDLIYREIVLTGVAGRRIWETWDAFKKVMQGSYYKPEKLIGGRFAMKDFKAAIARMRSGAPGKVLLYP